MGQGFITGKVNEVLTKILLKEGERYSSEELASEVDMSPEVLMNYCNHIKQHFVHYIFWERYDGSYTVWMPDDQKQDAAIFLKRGGYNYYMDRIVAENQKKQSSEDEHKKLVEENLKISTEQAKYALKSSAQANILAWVAIGVAIISAIAAVWQAIKTH